MALIKDWTLILLGPTAGDEDDQGDDSDGESETNLDPADALEDLVEVGHQLHLEHKVVRNPGLVLKPHDGEVGLSQLIEDGQSGYLLNLDIELEPGTDIQRDPRPGLDPEDGRVKTLVGRQSGLDLVEVERVRQVEVGQGNEDGGAEPARREVLVRPELVAADPFGVDPGLGEVELERSAQVIGVHLNEGLLKSGRVELSCPALNLSTRTGPVQGVSVIPAVDLNFV